MEKRVRICLFYLLCHTALVIAITCPGGRPFSCTTDKCSCLVTPTTQATFDSANTLCGDDGGEGSLILIRSERDNQLLQRYLEVLGESGKTYWVGYRYNATGDLEDINGEPAPDVVTDNIDDAGAVAADGVCLAARLNGTFTNVDCTVEMYFVCFVQYPVPMVTSVVSSMGFFVTDGSSVILTCNYKGAEAQWRKTDGSTITNGNGYTVTTTNTNVTVVIDSFDSSFVGDYECLVLNPIGTALSEAIHLEVGLGTDGPAPNITQLDVSYDSVGPLDNQEIRTIPLGVDITLTCGHSAGVAQWIINGVEEASADNITVVFSEAGVYQCRVTMANVSSVASIVLFGGGGIPGPVDLLTVAAKTKEVLNVSWLSPETLNVNDIVLLRYEILYTDGTFDFATADRTAMILPGMDIDSVVSFQLSGLSAGTTYTIAVLANSLGGALTNAQYTTTGTTFPNAPSEITNLKVSRTKDNKTIIAEWDEPDVDVYEYEVQYRNFRRRSNTIVVFSTIAIIQDVEDANDYEVRVRAAVQINDEAPPDLEFSPYTAWTETQGVREIPPTKEPVSSDDDTETIVISVVVPFVVVVAVVIILVVVIWCYCQFKSSSPKVEPDGPGGRERVDSGATELLPTDDKPPLPEP